MWEKLIGTHEKPNWIKLPSRIPVGEPPKNLKPRSVYNKTWTINQGIRSSK